ncbi:BRCT domain-containing protein [Paracoccus lutimaris]|uniref:BRCA1 C Terminus (BRCT) protein n=1 Tax=Paracoccus lutimaris TaxID=1490030 RepID=A0A368YYZ3_9RHOB|nr:BRCT domain-containing protein [Paracoccus lutimaris]RCW84869.1 hypothetical protein DFP89_107174 [Paracoccus lutimaris]
MSDAARAGRYLGAAICDRQVTELTGIARGLIADGHLSDAEIVFLHKWLAANEGVHSHPMVSRLIQRIEESAADKVIDEDERRDLHDTLNRLTGNDFELGEVLKSTTLPLDNPAPALTFERQRYCFTGTFVTGTRKQCEAEVISRGGRCGTIAWSTNVLVIGEYATASWAQSSFGRKIEQAVEWQNQGSPIRIVSEAHWRQHID